jgi:uncharacterized UPF0160 family protein
MIRKIITHDGGFHTDDIFAVSLLLLIEPNALVERKRDISEDEFEDPSIVIVDVGGRYQPELNNFDHHQNTEEVKDFAAFGLVSQKYLPKFIFGNKDYINSVMQNVQQNLITPIDKWDNGKVQKQVPDDVIPLQQMFRVIQEVNDPSSFQVATYIAQQIIKGYVRTASKVVDSEIIWARGVTNEQNIKIMNDFCMIWKLRAKQSKIYYAVWPEDENTFVVSTIDSETYPIANYQTPSRIFLHKSLFIAKYSNLADAIMCAKKSLKQVSKTIKQVN